MKPYSLANDLREPIQRFALLRVPHFVVPDGTVPPPITEWRIVGLGNVS